MSNPYYNFDTPLTPGTRGRAGELNDQFLAIQTGFDNIPGPGGAAFAVPTVKVGLTADIGVLNTALRSDARLVLDESITPTWTGFHKHTHISGIEIENTSPLFLLDETDAPVNERQWRLTASGGNLFWSTQNDLGGGAVDFMVVTRTGTTVDAINLTSTALTWNGAQLPALSTSNVWTGVQTISGGNPWVRLYETDAVLDEKYYSVETNGGILSWRLYNDALSSSVAFMTVDRAAMGVSSVNLFGDTVTFNGVASSDFARLSQSNTFTNAIQHFTAASPALRLRDSGAATNEKAWDIISSAGQFSIAAVNDAENSQTAAVVIDRTATTVDSIALTSTALTWNGTQVATLGANTFTSAQTLSSIVPQLYFNETDAGSNAKLWEWIVNGSSMFLLTRTDADGAGATPIEIARSGTTVTAINLVSTALTWNGSQVATLAANNVFTGNQSISGTAPSFYLIETDAASDTKIWRWNANGASLALLTRTDADGTGAAPIIISRSGTTVNAIDLVSTALTWNGTQLPSLGASNVFTGTAQTLTRADPSFRWSDTGASSGARAYAIQASGGSQFFQLFDDAFSSGTSWMSVQRSSNTATFINLTSTNLLWNGSPLALSGTYTPTLSNTLNVSASTSSVCTYLRVGASVTVSGSILVTPQNGTGQDTQLGISLPIASAFSTGAEAGGAGRHNNSAVGVVADAANDRALAEWFSGTTSSTRLDFTFTYRIV